MPETVILYCSDTCLYTSGYSVSQGVCPLGKDCQGFDHMNNIFCNKEVEEVFFCPQFCVNTKFQILACPSRNGDKNNKIVTHKLAIPSILA
jgi:hypothetical protein